jgi:hypothetical protein
MSPDRRSTMTAVAARILAEAPESAIRVPLLRDVPGRPTDHPHLRQAQEALNIVSWIQQ